MGIQVDNSLHAAATLVVSEDPDDPGEVLYSQSPQGCLLQRIEEGGFPALLVQLDYPLDFASCSLEVTPYVSVDPETEGGGPLQPLLIHLDDTTKLVVLIAEGEEGPTSVLESVHMAFTNYQANNDELYPVELVPTPSP